MTYRDHLPEGFTGRAMIRGDLLPAKLQADARRAYLHRFTREHIPLWSKKPRDNGEPYPLQFASDAEWLARTLFPVTVRKGGTLGDHTRAGNAHCAAFQLGPMVLPTETRRADLARLPRLCQLSKWEIRP